MLIVMLAALQPQVVWSPPLPRAPPPPPPFTRTVEAVAQRLSARVSDEYRRCGDARTNSNARNVQAFGTPARSAQWKKGTIATANALTVCRGLQRALRDQDDFLVSVAQSGSRHDADLAAKQLSHVSYELQAIEQYFATEAPRYRKQLTIGWGNPHCVERPVTGLEPPASLCVKQSGLSR